MLSVTTMLLSLIPKIDMLFLDRQSCYYRMLAELTLLLLLMETNVYKLWTFPGPYDQSCGAIQFQFLPLPGNQKAQNGWQFHQFEN